VGPIFGSGLLAASLLLGQTTNAQVIPAQDTSKTVTTYSDSSITPTQAQTQAPTQTPIQAQTPAPAPQRPFFSWFTSSDRPVLSRIQSWFGRKESTEPPVQQQYQPAPTYAPVIPTNQSPMDYPKRMPSPSSQISPSKDVNVVVTPGAPGTIQQTSLTMPAAAPKSPILPQLANKIGCDEKFEWITGQLETENGAYVLYYATPETVDKYHGRIVIQPQKVDMTQFRRGDLVSVRGDLIQIQTPQGARPVYRLSMAHLIERVKSN
jgi:hypothetical protein